MDPRIYSGIAQETNQEMQMVIDVTRGRYPVVVDHLVFELLQMRDSNFEQPPSAADMARCAFGFGDDGAPLPGGFRVHPELAAAGLWTTPYDLALMVIGIVQSRAGRPGAFLDQALAIEMLKPGAGGAGLGTIIDDKGMFWHNGGNVGFRSLYVGDPVSGNGMAAMTNGDKGAKRSATRCASASPRPMAGAEAVRRRLPLPRRHNRR
jgi:CubicO group peptidase (beta-lactamase class C family)